MDDISANIIKNPLTLIRTPTIGEIDIRIVYTSPISYGELLSFISNEYDQINRSYRLFLLYYDDDDDDSFDDIAEYLIKVLIVCFNLE